MKFLKLSLLVFSLIPFCSCNKIDMMMNSQRSYLYASLSPDSKTYLHDQQFGEVFWAKGDSISVFTNGEFPLGGYKFIAQDSSYVTLFECEQPVSASRYYAIYPYNSESNFSESFLNASATIPDIQTALPDNFDPKSLVVAGSSNTDEVPFYNVCGGIRFTISSEGITKVIFKANGTDIAGAIHIDFNSEIPVAFATSESKNSITLISETPLSSGSFYYISMLPVVLADGFSFEFYDASDNIVAETSCDNYVSLNTGVFATIYEADNQERVSKIADGINLSLNGSANCYIVTDPGTYKIAIVKGNSDTQLSGADNADILWQYPDGLIESVSVKGNFLLFKTSSDFKSGNAVAAVKQSDNILWSWHIWFSEQEPQPQTYQGTGAVMMDRNLGALSTDYSENSYGLLYQWGRKDPFLPALPEPFNIVTTSETVGTIDYASANPMSFICTDGQSYTQDWLYVANSHLWDSSKTIYDPCPPGWRIPDGGTSGGSVWDTDTDNARYDERLCGAFFTLADGRNETWYPNTGYLTKKGVYLMQGEFCDYWANTTTSNGLSDALELNVKARNQVANIVGKIRSEGHTVRCQKEN